ncbi:MAG: hypothetical protein JWO68_1053, partial [Actinomycetia bacterium]|nr:hypothetical protein [Actinomycetes bacterium]
MQVALLTTVLPEGRRTGGEIVSQTLVEALRAAGHQVGVVGYQRPDAPPATDAGAVPAGTRTIETGRAGRGQVARWMADAVRRGLPYSVAKYRSDEYLAAARTAVAGADVVLVDHAQVGWALDELRPTVPVVLVAHNVEHELYAEQRASGALPRRLVYGREERRMRALERRLAAAAAQVWVLTEADAAAFARLARPGAVRRFGVPGQAP